jgi:hypothetical protein
MTKKQTRKQKVYIAGPMRGYKDFNFPAFDKAATMLRKKGWIVFNPADKDRKTYGKGINKSDTGDLKDAENKGFSLRTALKEDTEFLCLHADAIALLPGWEKSLGATAEHALAQALGLRMIFIK